MSFTNGFRTQQDRDQHFDDHGAEFSAPDEPTYEEWADAFLGGPKKPTTLDCTRRTDGAYIRWDYTTQEFGILAADRHIQTYFKPDPAYHGKATNRAYFQWECSKR